MAGARSNLKLSKQPFAIYFGSGEVDHKGRKIGIEIE